MNGSTATEGLSGSGSAAGSSLGCATRLAANSEDPHRPCDVLELLRADVLEGEIELACGVLLYACRHADAARLGQAFEACGDVDTVAEDVAVLDDNVAQMDADPELDPIICRHGAFRSVIAA